MRDAWYFRAFTIRRRLRMTGVKDTPRMNFWSLPGRTTCLTASLGLPMIPCFTNTEKASSGFTERMSRRAHLNFLVCRHYPAAYYKPADYQPGAPPVFVMRYKTWKERFNGDPGVLNKTFVLNGTVRTLVGIMPPRFGWYDADLWIPETPLPGV